VYLELAYGPEVPAGAAARLPPEAPPAEPGESPATFDLVQWLMSDAVERTPRAVGLAQVRSFALRLGNRQFPHMKLRLALLPGGRGYVFDVDCHDALLAARPGSPDQALLAELKKKNAALASAITAAWEQLHLPTNKSYLRAMIAQRKQAASAPAP
jgi:hypothetical protein